MYIKHLLSIAATTAVFICATFANSSPSDRVQQKIESFFDDSTSFYSIIPTTEETLSSLIANGIDKLGDIAIQGTVHAAKRQLGLVYEDLKSLNATMTDELDNIAKVDKLYGGEAYSIGGTFLGLSAKLHTFAKKTTYAPRNVSSETAETIITGLSDTLNAWGTYSDGIQAILVTNPGFEHKLDTSVTSTSLAFKEAIAAYKKYIELLSRLMVKYVQKSF